MNKRGWFVDVTALSVVLYLLMPQALLSKSIIFPKEFKEARDLLTQVMAAEEGSEMESQALQRLGEIARDDDGPHSVRILIIQELANIERAAATESLVSIAGPGLTATDESEAILIRAAADEALLRSRVAQAEDGAAQECLLLSILRSPITDRVPTSSRVWAAQELCERGRTEHLLEINRVISKFVSSDRGREIASLCRLKAVTVATHDVYRDALKAALDQDDPFDDIAFHRWAIDELTNEGSDEAKAQLLDHARSLAASNGPALENAQVAARESELQLTVHALLNLGWNLSDLNRLIAPELSP